MAPVPDPYTTLGLQRGATLDEVKRAYRRLAKEHHPDSGGERALPRFLEIQAAYEQLVAPNGRARVRGAPSARTQQPWQADEQRADATRRAYGARARRSTGRAAGGQRAGSRGPDPDAAPRDRPSGRGRRTTSDRPPNKATFGSTTYDGAEAEPFEPGWTGASWYGTSSGTYWTLNPREYADPRKHGPEYQARARRARAEAAAAATGGPTVEPEAPPDAEPSRDDAAEPASDLGGSRAGDPGTGPGGDSGTGPADDSADPHVSGDTSPAGSWWTAPRRTSRPVPEPEPAFGPWAEGAPDLARPLPNPVDAWNAFVGRLVHDPPTGPAARLALAVAGGLPLLLGLVWLLGELSGCGRFAATCDPGLVRIGWLAGLGIVGLLTLVPRIASGAAVGSIAMAIAAVPTTVFLTATGGSRMPDAAGAILGVALALGWVVGVAYTLVRRGHLRRTRGPVS